MLQLLGLATQYIKFLILAFKQHWRYTSREYPIEVREALIFLVAASLSDEMRINLRVLPRLWIPWNAIYIP